MATATANPIARLSQLIDRIPIFPLFLAYAAYVGYQWYSFNNDADSPLLQAVAQVQAIKDGNVKLQTKLKEAQESTLVLAQKEVELRELARQLSEAKATLSEQTNEAEFLKLILKEANSVGLMVSGLHPTATKDYEYYSEQSFDVTFKGYFVQLVVFLDHLSQAERIVRVDNFEIHKSGNNLSPYVELSGTVQVKVYRYLGSQADELAKTVSPPNVKTPMSAPPKGISVPSGMATPSVASPAASPAPVVAQTPATLPVGAKK